MTQVRKVFDAKINGRIVNEGDLVKVNPLPGRRNGFSAKFISATVDAEGHVYDVTVYGGRGARKNMRTFPPERIATYRKQKEQRS